ncbi:MAG: FAD-dependent oxidoreductase [Burkholderiaceae bacterium]
MQTLLVFSHLRWDFVYQRPQHLLSRLARDYRVLFFEEPVRGQLTPFLERLSPCRNVEVLRPHTTVDAAGFHDTQLPELQPLLAEYLRDFGIDDYIAWFYTPMALPLLSELTPRAVIYDCMDELSAFRSAPRQMLQRESALLKRADLVLTGGPSLYDAKRNLHENVHCFPSAVDVDHYSPRSKRDPDPVAEKLLADVPYPRLGFFGVIDERFDLDLLRSLAAADSRWQIVLAGPVAKIDKEALPQGANIHWLGQQPYDRLPHLVSGWDVCLLPFALNAATRFISPTKTLEYMAGEKPVVSTAVHDVAKLYGDAVAVAQSHEDFIEACRDALTEDAEQRALRISRMRRHVERTTWDAAARAIRQQIEALMKRDTQRREERLPSRVAGSVPARSPEPLRVHSGGKAPTTSVRSLVVGAGPTGLAAAYHLGKDALLVEREATVGGWCRSIVDNGFTFDYAGHIMFSNDPYVLALYDKLLGENKHWQNREAWIYSKDVYTRYPFQGSLYGLPPQVLKECIVGAIEARFGPIKSKGEAPPSVTEQPPKSFEEFIYRVWGSGIAKHFAVPYNRKLWAVPLDEMETSWLGGRVPLPDLEQMIDGALEPTPPPMGPNARFGYPLRGGFQALMDAFLPHLTGEVALETKVLSVSPKRRTAALSDGRTVRFETLVSTMPLPALVAACGDEVPAELRSASRGLRHVSVRCVNLGVARENVTDKHWIYYPEDTVFHRIFVQGNASPHCNPPGGFGLTCEITYSDSKPLPVDGAELIERCRQDCIKVGMLREDDRLITANQVDMPIAYVVYDHDRAKNVDLIRDWMAQHGIILAGRYSEWEYYNSDHAFIAGRKAAEEAREAVRTEDKVAAV